jgi:hypothetical protein
MALTVIPCGTPGAGNAWTDNAFDMQQLDISMLCVQSWIGRTSIAAGGQWVALISSNPGGIGASVNTAGMWSANGVVGTTKISYITSDATNVWIDEMTIHVLAVPPVVDFPDAYSNIHVLGSESVIIGGGTACGKIFVRPGMEIAFTDAVPFYDCMGGFSHPGEIEEWYLAGSAPYVTTWPGFRPTAIRVNNTGVGQMLQHVYRDYGQPLYVDLISTNATASAGNNISGNPATLAAGDCGTSQHLRALRDFILQYNPYYTTGFANVLQYDNGLVATTGQAVFPADNLGNYFYLRMPNQVQVDNSPAYTIADNGLGIGLQYNVVLVACMLDGNAECMITNLLTTLMRYHNEPLRITTVLPNAEDVIFQELSKVNEATAINAVKNLPEKLTICSIHFTFTIPFVPQQLGCLSTPCKNC